MADHERSSGSARLVTVVTWAVLLCGLWLWGRQVTGVAGDVPQTAAGDLAAIGRPPEAELPSAVRPLKDALPQRVDIPGLGVQAPVIARGLDARGAVEPPSFAQAGAVGWYAAGTTPGADGAALMVGHVDTRTRPAVFYRLSTMRPGQTVRVLRDDGGVAEFTVDDVQVQSRDRFDAARAYGQHRAGRAELRLITCGGTFDRAGGTYTANVIVSAYLTGTGL
ncbi:class F sortase [Streptomyces sp. NPDC048419]|uniref:class F sortase n=1 Tax=Streptomyces sp. NPDC048419 TaxID=3365547 RepID=UPI0037120B10